MMLGCCLLMSQETVKRFATARVPTNFGEFVAHVYRVVRQAHQSIANGLPFQEEHVAFVMGEIAGGEPPLVRLHSECLTGDVLFSQRCDCGQQLQEAVQMIASEGRGVLVYLRGQEGRGIGIGHKLRAYALQDEGLDTVEANEVQGLPVDSRSYSVGVDILTDLGIHTLRLMTNNPHKHLELRRRDLKVVERVPIEIAANPENVRYLATKRDRLGHLLHSDF